MRHRLAPLALLAGLTAVLPAHAADPVADPASPVGLVGKVIVDQAAGRSREAALAAGNADSNPYGLADEALTAAAGVKKMSPDASVAARAGELSILPQFTTPGGTFTASAETPPTIPFAFVKSGKCQAGYVAGFPAPAETYSVDLTGKPCSAKSVDELNAEAYLAIEAAPHSLSDADLELAVRAAYAAASALSSANGNYFARDGVFAPLRDAIASAEQQAGFDNLIVPETAAADLAAARRCRTAVGTELRIATNTYGDGVSLVAVTDKRVFSYHYDPHEKAEVVVAPGAQCTRG